jgi:2-keto-4-pentenoate hydratase/2-oxohepta-3-ene-1,7-dioic acid hydratase in catechol pathway
VRLVSFEGGFGRVEGDDIIPMGRDLAAYLATGETTEAPAVALGSVQLLAPIPRPGKEICIGLNHRDHAEESGLPLPQVPSCSRSSRTA